MGAKWVERRARNSGKGSVPIVSRKGGLRVAIIGLVLHHQAASLGDGVASNSSQQFSGLAYMLQKMGSDRQTKGLGGSPEMARISTRSTRKVALYVRKGREKTYH